MSLAPVGLSSLDNPGDILLFPYFIDPAGADSILVLDLLYGVELGDVFMLWLGILGIAAI